MPDLFERLPIAWAPISVILTARNPGDAAVGVVSAWTAVLDELENEYEILVADDGSDDGSPEGLTTAFADVANFKLLRTDSRSGVGAALRLGLAETKYPLVCTAPLDRQYEPADLKSCLAEIDKVDLALGCRKHYPVPGWYRLLEYVYRSFVRLVFGVTVDPLPCWLGWKGFWRRRAARWLFGILLHDPECPFRLARRHLFQRIPIQADGDFAQVEIIAKANFLGAILTETVLSWRPPENGESAAADSAGGLWWQDMRRVLSRPTFGPTDVAGFSLTPFQSVIPEPNASPQES